MSAVVQFRSFLSHKGINYVDENVLTLLIDKNFDFLTSDMLKDLTSHAMTEIANGASKIAWGEIFDSVREVTMRKRQQAESNLVSLLNHFQTLDPKVDKKGAAAYLREFHDQNKCTGTFMELLQNTIDACKQTVGQENAVSQLEFFQKVFQSLFLVKANMNAQERRYPLTEAAREEEDDSSDDETDAELVRAGEYVQKLLKDCAGDVAQLKLALVSNFSVGSRNDSIKFTRDSLLRVIEDNITACIQAGYVNKRRIFEFMNETVNDIITQERANLAQSTGNTTYHAPQFIDNGLHGDNSVVVDSDGKFINAEKPGALFAQSSGKKKSVKRALKVLMSELADTISSDLGLRGVSVCDHFIPLDLVRRIRIECGIFQEYYEASEIWVGKEADVGAHLTVPSVRGDRVLWMCGAHSTRHAPEGNIRAVKTLGEIEPCRLHVKAVAPVRKFNALKEFVERIDSFVSVLKGKVVRLKGIYERSDVMFSIYSDGARFANHIDNTTQDGRVLTVVCYLNPEWNPEFGGALRVQFHDKSGKVDSESGPSNSKSDSLKSMEIFPECGRVVFFYSSEIPHEVLPSYKERHACTIWYYDMSERTDAVKRAVESGRSAEVDVAGVEAQTEARGFIADLMGDDTETTNNSLPVTDELLSELNYKVQNELTPEALKIVSSITGAPSPESFKEGFGKLTVADLMSIRALFRRMGLKG